MDAILQTRQAKKIICFLGISANNFIETNFKTSTLMLSFFASSVV